MEMASTSADLPDNAFQRVISVWSDSHLAYKVIGFFLFSAILYRQITASQKDTPPVFPRWAAIEIALTAYVVSNGGLGQRIW